MHPIIGIMIQIKKGSIPFNVLEEILTLGEGYKSEFQQTLPSPQATAKSICAFANTKGGNLFIGVNKNGIASGVLHTKYELAKLEEAFPLLIPKPDISVRSIIFKNMEILYIEVNEGNNKPYYVKNSRDTRAYIRGGKLNLPATKRILKTFIDSKNARHKMRKALQREEKLICDLFEESKQLHLSQIKETLNLSERKVRKRVAGLVKLGILIPSPEEKDLYSMIDEPQKH